MSGAADRVGIGRGSDELQRQGAPSSRAAVDRAEASDSSIAYPRVVIQREAWRIVQYEASNTHGVLDVFTATEIADGKDAMGQTRWTTLTDKNSSWSAWRSIAAELISEALESSNEHR